MTVYIYSKSEPFKAHVDKMIGESVQHKLDIASIKASIDDLIIIHASSYSNIQLNETLKLNVDLAIAIADDLPDIGRMLRFTNLNAKAYCNAYMAKSHYRQLILMLKEGQSWFPPELLSQALALAHSSVRPEDNDELLETLTPRQKQIALCIAEGKSNKLVAESCGIAERTVKSHLTQIFNKLNVSDRIGLVIYLKKLNLLNSNKRSVD